MKLKVANKMPTKREMGVYDILQDKKLWRPPTLATVAEKMGVTTGYVEKLRNNLYVKNWLDDEGKPHELPVKDLK